MRSIRRVSMSWVCLDRGGRGRTTESRQAQKGGQVKELRRKGGASLRCIIILLKEQPIAGEILRTSPRHGI